MSCRSTFPIIIIACLAVAYCFARYGSPEPDRKQMILIYFFGGLVVLIVSVPIMITRSIRHGELSIPVNRSETQTDAIQFEIRHLFILTTIIAVLLGIGRILHPYMSAQTSEPTFEFLKIGISLGLCSLVVIWATLGRSAHLRTALSTIAVAAICFLNPWEDIPDPDSGWFWACITIFVWLQVNMLMWSLRWEGYRFVVREADSDEAENAKENEDDLESGTDPLA